jgi:hypothetical protein
MTADAAGQVHFSLDSTAQFKYNSPAFHYSMYFKTLLASVEEMTEAKRTEVLAWYTEYVALCRVSAAVDGVAFQAGYAARASEAEAGRGPLRG